MSEKRITTGEEKTSSWIGDEEFARFLKEHTEGPCDQEAGIG